MRSSSQQHKHKIKNTTKLFIMLLDMEFHNSAIYIIEIFDKDKKNRLFIKQ